MDDSVSIVIGGKTITGFTRYNIEHNIYTAAASFSVDVSPAVGKQISTGDRIELKVNNTTALTGLVEKKEDGGSKSAASITISGRDLMGLVVDCHIEDFHTLRNKKLMDVAEQYLGEIDYVKSQNITYMDGSASLDVAQEYVQPRPGQTVFELLSGIAAARGIHFYMRADGNIVFGKPKGYGSHIYSVWRTEDGYCNLTEWKLIDDISQRYSDVTVLGQQQSTVTTALSAINKKATATDNTFPLAFNKPMVVETQTAAETLSQQARMIVEQQRFDGWFLRYKLPGHTQRGYVWQPDTVCSVDDYRLGLRGEFLVYSRSFVLDKKTKSTEIILGKMADAT